MSMSICGAGISSNWWLPATQSNGSSTSGTTAAPAASSSMAPASTIVATGSADLASVFQQFATALQSMLVQNGAATGTAATTTSATTGTTGTTADASQTSTQQAGGGHHHHHHGGGGPAQGAANQLVSEVDQLLNGGTTSIGNIGSTIAADVMQALQSYDNVSAPQNNGILTTTA